MKKYKTVFIDLDGTLTDSRPGIVNSIRYGLTKMNLSVPDEDTLLKFIGPPLLESFATHCGLTGKIADEALEAYREYFREKGMFENSVYEGIPEALEKLKNAGFRLAVATSKPEEFSVKIISHFDLDKYFEIVAGASMDETRNTKPEVIAYALSRMGITDPKEVIMVGDRHHDAEGAAQNNIECIGVTYGYGSEEELLSAGVIALAKSPLHLADILLA